MTLEDDIASVEIQRLRAQALADKTRIRELEEALARCVAQGVRLRDALAYFDDVPPSRPQSHGQ